LCQGGAVYDYIETVRKEYKIRAEAMVTCLRKHLPQEITFTAPRGGFYIWLDLPKHIDSTEVLKRAIDKGVVFVSGKTFDPHGILNNKMRLSYCNTSVEKIREGIPLVAEAIREIEDFN